MEIENWGPNMENYKNIISNAKVNGLSLKLASEKDAALLADLIQQVLERSNAQDYSSHVIEFMKSYYSTENIREKMDQKTTWILESIDDEAGKQMKAGDILGTISLCESEVQALFVSERVQGKGCGRILLSVLEAYAYDHGKSRLHLNASLTAKAFYDASGYVQLETVDDPDFGPSYYMEKKLV